MSRAPLDEMRRSRFSKEREEDDEKKTPRSAQAAASDVVRVPGAGARRGAAVRAGTAVSRVARGAASVRRRARATAGGPQRPTGGIDLRFVSSHISVSNVPTVSPRFSCVSIRVLKESRGPRRARLELSRDRPKSRRASPTTLLQNSNRNVPNRYTELLGAGDRRRRRRA